MTRQAIDFIKRSARQCGIEISRARPPVQPTPPSGPVPPPEPVLGSNILALTISDVLLRIVLSDGRHSDFTFVQIGANDGIMDDPIRKFVLKYGLRGVFVEPQPDVFARLQRNYAGVPNLAFENAAIAAQDGQREMYRFRKTSDLPFWADGLASFSKETLIRNFQNVEGEVETIHVPTLSFRSLLGKHGLEHLDLLQIDTEGFDYEIIKMIDFSATKPTIIHFEHGFLSGPQQYECFRYLNNQGYRVTNNDENMVAYAEPKEQRLDRNWVAALPDRERELLFDHRPEVAVGRAVN